MKRITVAILIIIFSVISLFAGEEKVVETRHFRIIYSDETRNAASEIFNSCEESYSDLVEFFGEDPEIFLPVYVEKDEKEFNAYFTSYPYNRIVVFDTAVDSSLDNGKNPIAMTFRHELTHAFTYSFKGSLGKTLVSIFGDWANPTVSFHLLPFLTEGIAVYMESKEGEGRLNDPFFLSYLQSSVSEDLKLSYMDIAGSRDIYPGGSTWYTYGGAFVEWMGIKYGEKDLSTYYIKMAKELFSFPQNTYSSLFDVSLWDDWFVFMEGFERKETATTATIHLDESRRYSDIVEKDGEIYVLSSTEEALLRVTEEGKEKVFSFYTPSPDISVSEDGFFLLPYTSETQSWMALYGEDGKLENKYPGYVAGSFFGENLLLFRYDDRIMDMDTLDREGNVISSTTLGYNVTVRECVNLDGCVYFLLSRGGEERIAYTLDGENVSILETPEDISFSSLSASRSSLSFSWKEKSETKSGWAKYGEIDTLSKTMKLSRQETEGGMNGCAAFGDKLWFVQTFFDHSALSFIPYDDVSFEEEIALSSSLFYPEEAPDTSEMEALSYPYNPLSTMTKGALLPYYLPTSTFMGNYALFGASWYTMDATERVSFTASAGYDFKPDAALLGFRVDYGPFFASVLTKFRSDFFAVEGDLGASIEIPLSHRDEKISLEGVVGWENNYTPSFHNYISLSYSNIRQKGLGRYKLSGYAIRLSEEDLDPRASFTLYLPGFGWDSFYPGLDSSLPSRLTVSSNLGALTFSPKVNLLTFEEQRGIRFLGLYMSHFDLYASSDITWVYGGPVYQDYALGLTAFLSPVLGTYSRSVLEIGAELHYTPLSGFDATLVMEIR